MEPKGNPTIEHMAAHDPVAALAMALHVQRVPYSWTITGQFSTLDNFEETVAANQQEPLSQRTWIESIEYNILLPNVFTGQVLKSLSDAALRYSTGVIARLWCYDGPKYVIAQDFTPLENLLSNVEMRWPAGWRLEKNAALKADLQLTQAPYASDSNIGPMIVNITFNGFQFFDPFIDQVPPFIAAQALREAGYCLPDVGVCAAKVRNSMGIGQLPPDPYGKR